MGGGGPAPRVLQLEVPETPPSGPSQVSPYTLQGCFHFQGSPEPNSVCLLVTYKVPKRCFRQIPACQERSSQECPGGWAPPFPKAAHVWGLHRCIRVLTRPAGPPVACVVSAWSPKDLTGQASSDPSSNPRAQEDLPWPGALSWDGGAIEQAGGGPKASCTPNMSGSLNTHCP